MAQASELKLIDLLSMRPGALLRVNAVTGEVECLQAVQLLRHSAWKQEVSSACFPGGDPQKLSNFSSLLDVPIDTQIIVRHSDGKVVEILRLDATTWKTLLGRAGHKVDIMVDGRVIAGGIVVDTPGKSGIFIEKVVSHS